MAYCVSLALQNVFFSSPCPDVGMFPLREWQKYKYEYVHYHLIFHILYFPFHIKCLYRHCICTMRFYCTNFWCGRLGCHYWLSVLTSDLMFSPEGPALLVLSLSEASRGCPDPVAGLGTDCMDHMINCYLWILGFFMCLFRDALITDTLCIAK